MKNKPEQDAPTNNENKKIKIDKKGKIIITLVSFFIIAIVIAIIILSILFSPTNKIANELKAGNYEEAYDLFADKKDNVDENALINTISERLKTLQNDFKNDIISYDNAISEINTLSKMDLESGQSIIDETKVYIEDLQKSHVAFESGKTYESESDYTSAISAYSKVIEDDTNYNNAQKSISDIKIKYKKQVLDNVETNIKNSEYENAIEALNTALVTLENDIEINTKLSECLTKYKTQCIDKADKLIKEDNFEEAEEIIDNAVKLIPNDTDLTKKQKEISDSKPVQLKTLHLIDSTTFADDLTFLTDSYGRDYDDIYSFRPHNDEDSSYAIYNLNKEFSSFSGSIVTSQDTYQNQKITVAIYVDDKLKFSKKDIVRSTDKIDFNINVKSGSKLEIKTTHETPTGYSDYIYIVNTKLTKSK